MKEGNEGRMKRENGRIDNRQTRATELPAPASRLSSLPTHSWRVTDRGPCSSSCGLGVATQSVACVRLSGGREVEVAEGQCPEAEKPLSVVPCLLRVCPYEWGFTKWTEVVAR